MARRARREASRRPVSTTVEELIEQAVAEGYPRHVEDPAVLERVAAIMRGADARTDVNATDGAPHHKDAAANTDPSDTPDEPTQA